MAKINLKAYTYPTKRLDFRAGDILKKVRQNQELARMKQSFGLVTTGIIEAKQVEGGYGWAISDYIPFSYTYVFKPIFTWGLEGTAQLDFSEKGDNMYGAELPGTLQEFYSEENGWDASEYQPAIFVPRIIHWNIENYLYKGCYILVSQLNPETTETDKIVRIHFLFTGTGYQKGSS